MRTSQWVNRRRSSTSKRPKYPLPPMTRTRTAGNVGGYHQVRTDALPGHAGQWDQIRKLFDSCAAYGWEVASAEDLRCDECHNLIDDSALKGVECKVRSAFIAPKILGRRD